MFQAFRNIRIGVFIAFVNLLIQGISFFVQNFIARNLGTASYGHFGLLQTDYSIFCAIADFGMTTLILAFSGAVPQKVLFSGASSSLDFSPPWLQLSSWSPSRSHSATTTRFSTAN
jgi:hypothetical protein